MSESINLSQGEKLILLMLCDVYDHLNLKRREFNPAFIREAIYSGNLWGLDWGITDVFQNTGITEAIASETVDILMMWRRLEESYEALTPENRDKFAALMGDFPQKVSFTGFDNNNEIPHISAARFLIEQLGMFENFKGRSLDAHVPTIEAHRRMWVEFKPLLQEVLNREFSAEQLAKVMLARLPPSM